MALEKASPATPAAKPNAERRRIPMSVPVQKLEAPDIPGFHLHWFNGTPERIQRALDAGYEYVDEKEVKPNNVSLGSTSTASGNTDMGSRVSIVSGDQLGKDGQPLRMVLMKIRQEWYEEDQKLVTQKNEQVAASLRGGLVGSRQDYAGDTAQRYVDKSRTKIPDMFNPNKRRKVAS